MKHFINLKDIPAKDLRKIIIDAKKRKGLRKKLMDNKLLTIRAAENTVRLLPPLNVKKNELDQALKIINKVCTNFK